MRTPHKATDERRANFGSGGVQTLLLQQCWWGAQWSVALQLGWQRSHPKRQNSLRGTSKNPARNAEPSPPEEFQFYTGKNKASSLIMQH